MRSMSLIGYLKELAVKEYDRENGIRAMLRNILLMYKQKIRQSWMCPIHTKQLAKVSTRSSGP